MSQGQVSSLNRPHFQLNGRHFSGFGMQATQYVFLRRNLTIDSQRMSRAIDYYSDMQRPYQVDFIY